MRLVVQHLKAVLVADNENLKPRKAGMFPVVKTLIQTWSERERLTKPRLARDYNVTPQLNTRGKNKGKPKESVEDAMRREVADIGLRQTGKMRDDKGNVVDRPIEEREGEAFAGMRRRGDERREAKRAPEGDAFAPSNIVPEEAPTDTERPVQEPLTFDEEPQEPAMPEAPSPEAEAAARADAPAPKPVQEPLTFDEPETAAPPDTGVVAATDNYCNRANARATICNRRRNEFGWSGRSKSSRWS